MPALGVFGTGQVGQAIARRAAAVGYDVTVGARSADSPSLEPFAHDSFVGSGSFRDAAEAAPLIVNAARGDASLAILESGGAEVLSGKVLLDVSNDLAPVAGGFPLPTATATNSLGQRLQQAFGELRVVKALNTMNNTIMVNPALIPGDHLAFLCGDDPAAKDRVRELLIAFGWREPQLMDLGGIDAAAATEMMMAIWMRVTLARGNGAPRFNWAILEAEQQ